MKFICDHSKECDDETCPHRQSHDAIPACSFPCGRVAGAKCVMDVAALPRFDEETGTMAIMIKRREA